MNVFSSLLDVMRYVVIKNNIKIDRCPLFSVIKAN